jgi:hypothetical protein
MSRRSEHLAAAREFIKDTVGDPETVDSASPDDVIRHIDRTYSGPDGDGWDGFVANEEWSR